MASINFLPGTVVTSTWLNEVDAHVFQGRNYDGLGVVNVRDPQFGAVGDGVTNDTAAMTAAHATGKLVYYPSGTYLHDPGISFSSGGIIGDGPLLTTLLVSGTGTENGFIFTGALGTYSNIPLFHGVTFKSDVAKTNGAAVKFIPASGETSYIDVRNCHFLYYPIQLDFVAASLWKVDGCAFMSYSVAGIQVANTHSADSGDSVVSNCIFNNPYTTGSGIWQKSSGGLKIIGNKFLGGARGYTMALEGSTSVLIITGNSFENMAQQDIVLSQATGGTAFVNVCITGNEFSVGGVAIATDSSGFLSEVNISGNQINMGATGSNACVALNSVTDGYIGGNLIKGNGGLGSSAVNLTNCTNVKIGINAYANLPTPLAISGGTGCTTVLQSQSGSVTTATSGWLSYGSQYLSPLQTVTFTTPFLITPSINDVRITPIAANGEIGAIVATISKTQLQFYIISNTTSIAAQAAWQVMGTL